MKKKSTLTEGPSRRDILSSGLVLAASSVLMPGAAVAEITKTKASQASPDACRDFTYDGSSNPFPVPWLDKNGSHNQPAGPGNEPSLIYHFKGRVARCSDFNGMGTDNNGNRLAFGSPTTDNAVMQGEYFTGREVHRGAFAHL